MRLLWVVVALMVGGLVAATLWQVSRSPEKVLRDTEVAATSYRVKGPAVTVPILVGESPEEIGKRLEDAGVIDSSLHFRVLVSLLGYNRQLQAGDYELNRNMSTLAALRRIRDGIVSPLQVTIPEGLRREEVAAILEKASVVESSTFLRAAVAPYDFTFLDEVPSGASLEGYLFPATYFLRRDMDPREVVERFLQAFDQRLSPDLREEATGSGLSLHDIVTIASIVEREAVLAEERSIIAQVFLDRLRAGIRLDADPTVQYSVANDPRNVDRFGYWKEALTEEDLFLNSPYNTYQVNGLPPGPIANPGIASIEAVIRPAETNYLYFVAKGDGSHAFAETIDDHQLNVDIYQGRGQ